MKFPSSIFPVSMGQPCTLCLADGAQITGNMAYWDDGVIALDKVVTSASMDDFLHGGLGLFPFAQVRWIKPEQGDSPGPL
ncbi:MAG: hypothetical protein NTV11_18020 [Rhodocyclales bacterium]|nr:hypothetical protein [Rhodocyclales bacterium]